MNVLKEQMRKVNLYPFNCRLWIDDNKEEPADHFDRMIDKVYELYATAQKITGETDLGGLARAILMAIPDVNAVEIVHQNGNGVVLYKDWP